MIRSTAFTTLLCFPACFADVCVRAQGEVALPSRDDIVARQARFEGAVTSCIAEFEMTCKATSPDAVPWIVDVIDQQFVEQPPDPQTRYTPKENEHLRYVLAQDVAESRSYSGRLVRERDRMRLEQFAMGERGSGQPRKTVAFDGEFVRSLSLGPQGARGSVWTIDEAHWHSGPDVNPYNLTFLCHGRPWSEVMRRASTFTISALPDQAPAAFLVDLTDADAPNTRYTLQLDAELRPLVRDKLLKLPRDKAQRVYERVRFSEWQDHRLARGGVVSFPMRQIVQYTVGATEHGELAVYKEDDFSVQSIEFNQPVDDSLFTLEFPPHAEVDQRKPQLP